MNTFAYNLEFLRKSRKLTQKQVALALGIKLKRYEAWEDGRNYPSVSMLPQLCEFFEFYDIYRMLKFRLTEAPKPLESYFK